MLEAVFAMVILAVAAAGVLLPFSYASTVQGEAQRQAIASRLAADLMEKIAACPYSSIISTYNGYSEAAGSLRDNSGQTLTGPAYSGLSRSATCQTATVSGVNLIWTTVRVYYNNAMIAQVNTLIGDQTAH